jgi:hypothetical protein
VTVLGVLVAGGIGAVLRYVVDHLVQRRARSEFPVGTMVINLSGSFVLGVLTGSALHHGVSAAWPRPTAGVCRSSTWWPASASAWAPPAWAWPWDRPSEQGKPRLPHNVHRMITTVSPV